MTYIISSSANEITLYQQCKDGPWGIIACKLPNSLAPLPHTKQILMPSAYAVINLTY